MQWSSLLFYFAMTLPLIVDAFSETVYDEFLHYAKYAALSACITKNRLFEGKLVDGACDLDFCLSNERNENVEIVKIRNAGIDENGTGFVALDKNNEEIIVSFRGTTTTTDWFTDVQLFPVRYESDSYNSKLPACEGCKVHYGFYKSLEQISDTIIAKVDELFKEYPDFKLIITGHSLGAALATLVGVEFRAKGYKPLVISYGSPKIFNAKMGIWVNSIFDTESLIERVNNGGDLKWGLVRIIHDEDYVTSLPPKFREAGAEFLITKIDLPHEQKDVKFLGSKYLESNSRWDQIADPLHAYQHRTYFMTINKCANF